MRAVEPVPAADRRCRHADLVDLALGILAVARRRRPRHGHTAMHTAPIHSIALVDNSPGTARALQNIARTTPRRWRNVAGWQKHRSLDRALFEFAHANWQSRVDATNHLLDIHYDCAEDRLQQRVARQTALDKVTAIAAAETIRVVAAQQSPAIATTMREALHNSGLASSQTTPQTTQQARLTTLRGTRHHHTHRHTSYRLTRYRPSPSCPPE